MQHQSGIGALHFLETDTTVYFGKVRKGAQESSAFVAILWGGCSVWYVRVDISQHFCFG